MDVPIKYFVRLFTVVLAAGTVSGQALGTSGQKSLNDFRNIASAQGRFEYFFEHEEGYGRTFEGDWKRLLEEEYRQAISVGDTLGGLYYGSVLSRILLDKGEVLESLKLGEKIYSLRGQNADVEKVILETLFDGYRSLGRITEQVEIYKKQRAGGYDTKAEPYEIYEDAGDFSAARHAFVSAYVPLVKGDTLQRVHYYNRLGWYRLKLMKNLEEARENLVRADSLLYRFLANGAPRTPSVENRANVLNILNTSYMGWCLTMMGERQEGVRLIREGIRSIQMVGDPALDATEVDLVHVLANELFERKYYRQLGRYLRGIVDKGSPSQQARTRELLSEYHYQTGNYFRAHQNAKEAFELNRSLNEQKQELVNYQSLSILSETNNKNSKNTEGVDAQASYELMKSEQDRILGLTLSLILVLMGFIALVFAYVKNVRHSNIILDQKKYIEKSLREKESLLKEIHHRVRNNLQMVSSLLSLQTKNTRDKAAIVALEEGKSRVKAMALIHQKLYQNDKLSSVGMQEYIESLVKSIQQVYKRADGEIEVRIDARGTELDIDQAIPIGLILNELVSNSFKHAFPYPIENPTINIQLMRKNGQGYFEYTDNGVGLPEDSEHKSKTSMGLRLINRLVNQLQSQLNTDNSRQGVRFWFTY